MRMLQTKYRIQDQGRIQDLPKGQIMASAEWEHITEVWGAEISPEMSRGGAPSAFQG